MDPLRGKAEQISARTAAVMTMKMKEMMYEDLKWVGGTIGHPKDWREFTK